MVKQIENIIQEYILSQGQFYREFETNFLENNNLLDSVDNNFDDSVERVIAGAWDWDISGPEEGLAYDIGYVSGLKDALRIIKKETK